MHGNRLIAILTAALCAAGSQAQQQAAQGAMTVAQVSASGALGTLNTLPVISHSGSREAVIGGFLVSAGSAIGPFDGVHTAEALTSAFTFGDGRLSVSAPSGATVRIVTPDGRTLLSRKVRNGQAAFPAAALPATFIVDVASKGLHRSFKFSK